MKLDMQPVSDNPKDWRNIYFRCNSKRCQRVKRAKLYRSTLKKRSGEKCTKCGIGYMVYKSLRQRADGYKRTLRCNHCGSNKTLTVKDNRDIRLMQDINKLHKADKLPLTIAGLTKLFDCTPQAVRHAVKMSTHIDSNTKNKILS